MTPLHTPPAAPIHTSYAPLAPSQSYTEVVQQWVDEAVQQQGGYTLPDEGRTHAAHQILDAYQRNSAHLDLSGYHELTTLPTLPAGLTTLNFRDCHALTTLPTLPAGLTTLDFRDCHALTTLPTLPAGLTTLDLTGCSALTTLPNLPTGITTLDFHGCSALTTLPESLPAGLTRLDFSYCRSLTALSESLPAGLIWLNLNGCHALTALPAHLPAGLAKLNLNRCHALTALPAHLPAGLIWLNLNGCHALTALSAHLPAGLARLSLNGCHALMALPAHLPAGLARLSLNGCHALMALPANLPQHIVIEGYQPPVLTPINILAQWCHRAGKSPEYTTTLNNKWQELRGEDGFNPFETLIRRLGEPQLLNSVSPGAVLALIESVIQSPDIRRLIFAASRKADANCHDRPLTIFNTVQGLALFATLQREGATPQAILNLAIGMAKLALLDEVTPQVMQKQWQEQRRTPNAEGTGPNTRAALEVQLALRHQLGVTLGLPFLVHNPLYATNSAQLNEADRTFATAYVNETVNNKERLTDALLAQPIWQLYLESILAKEISVINDLYAERQAQLEQEMVDGSFNDADFLQAINTLMEERQGAIDAPFKQKTAELLAQRE